MHLLSDLDRGLVEPYAEGIVGASWHLMQQALPLMVKHEVCCMLCEGIRVACGCNAYMGTCYGIIECCCMKVSGDGSTREVPPLQ